MKKSISIFIFVCFSFLCNSQTTIKKQNDKWQILVNGKPFPIKGVTFGYDKDVTNYDAYFKELKFLGVNTIRTWASGKNTPKLLNAANANGFKVMLGIWMRHGRPGMEDDDSFNYLTNTKGKEDQYNNALNVVKKYKDHPDILTWGIGNEVYLNMSTDKEKVAYSKLLERICSDIKKIDKNYPITSVEAWTFGIDWWKKYVPSLDIYGINTYGAGANVLPKELSKKGVKKPYVITEFGVRGEWEIKNDKNGVKLEPTDKEKYDVIVTGYNKWIQPKKNCLGVYVFHYANDSRHMAPWLLTHFNYKKRPQYWAIRKAYTGKEPINNVPVIQQFTIKQKVYPSKTWIPVSLQAFDKENEELDVVFYYNQRTGSRIRKDQVLKLNQRGNLKEGFEIETPKIEGGIKVYATVSDSFGNVGIETTSISVIDEEAKNRKFLVPKVTLPFIVYEEGDKDLPYVPSGMMGNYKDVIVDTNYTDNQYRGNSCIKISYNTIDNWYGVGFVNPANDWGEILGGYDVSGAKKFSFWAKTNETGVEASVGFGLIGKDQKFYDTAKKEIKIKLTKKWKKYTIKTKNLDLTTIRSGFVLFSSANGYGHQIFIDDVIFE